MRLRSITSTESASPVTATSTPQPECIRIPRAARFIAYVQSRAGQVYQLITQHENTSPSHFCGAGSSHGKLWLVTAFSHKLQTLPGDWEGLVIPDGGFRRGLRCPPETPWGLSADRTPRFLPRSGCDSRSPGWRKNERRHLPR